MNISQTVHRRQFIKDTALLGAAVGLAPNLLGAEGSSPAGAWKGGKIRVGEIGCGNVSGSYLPNLTSQPFIEVVSVCDIIVERAKKRAQQFKVPNVYPNIDEMLAGAPFDLLVNTTSMPSHFPVNKKALQAKRNVWSEKPIALSVKDGKELLELAKRQGVVKVEADENTMLIMNHGNGVLSNVQTGFVYFDGERLAGEGRQLYTIDVTGTKGTMHMQGWDWGPGGVDVASQGEAVLETFC